MLKSLKSLSENSLNDDFIKPSTETVAGGENTISVQYGKTNLTRLGPGEYWS